MKLLYCYIKFLNRNGEEIDYHGLDKVELNLSSTDRFDYDPETNTLQRLDRNAPLPADFWVNGDAESNHRNLYNVNVIAGENGSGKTTAIRCLMRTLESLYAATYESTWKNGDIIRDRVILLFYEDGYFWLLDYWPHGSQRGSIKIDGFQGQKIQVYQYEDWDALRTGMSKKENHIAMILRRTKVAYMTNTLNQYDYERHYERHIEEKAIRLRDPFIYDVSIGSALGTYEDRYFLYEIYKQVKYVFDREQVKKRRNIPEFTMPRALRLRLRMKSDLEYEFYNDKEIKPSGDTGQILTQYLGKLCADTFCENLELSLKGNRGPVEIFDRDEDKYSKHELVDRIQSTNRWHYTRGAMVGSFGRHDFSLKWSFGEMIYTGARSGLVWGKEQVIDSYKGMCELLFTEGIEPAVVLNGSAANTSLLDKSVDITCWDPPYYNNVQYAELADYFYVWQKRTFKNLYPSIFSRLMTNKEDEAVANPVRAGSTKEADKAYEDLMGEIFKEIRRVTKDEGIMTMMFTHKSQDAWETLTRALIENGWVITSTFPVDSESASSLHQKDMAAAASSIFITCRKRDMEHEEVSTWQGFGQTGVVHQVRQAVRDGLKSYEGLHLNAVDEMVASYGCALKVLSENWPVRDGEEMVSPTKAMREASTVVAQYQMERLTGGQISATDLDAEAGMVMTMLGIYSTGKLPFDDALTLSRSLNVRLENVGVHGYRVDGNMLGIGDEKKDEPSYAPVVRKGSNLRILLPEERNPKRLEIPQTEWDILQGVIMAYRDGDIPVARAYLQTHATGNEDKIIALIRVWADNCGKESLKKEADRIVYGLK